MEVELDCDFVSTFPRMPILTSLIWKLTKTAKVPQKRAEIKKDDVCVSNLQKIKGKWTIFNRKRGQEDNDILIIGDSIVGGICANGVDIFAINGGRTTDVISRLYILPLVKHKTIFS